MFASGRPLNSQAQQMVLNLLNYFEQEKRNGGPLISVAAVQERVADALQISKGTILAIKKRKENNPVLSSPGKTRRRQKSKTTDLPEGTKMEVRNTLYNMYKEKKHVTVKTLNEELREKEIVYMGKTSLTKLLKELGFKFKNEDNRRALTERINVVAKRGKFLREYIENMKPCYPREVIFLDETWIYAKGSKRMSWQDDTVQSVRKPEGYDGKRFIILHAGSSKGFVSNADLLFASKSHTTDYHGEMNSIIFTKWVTEQLIPNLEEPSLIVMDNAPYHSVIVEKQPTTSMKKSEIIAWLTKYNISHKETMTVGELLFLAKQNRREDKYIIDELLREHGHDVLRLPPYHCEFNAIELIWAKAKGYYNDHIGRDGYGDDKVINMWKEALATCDETMWQNCVRHTEGIIKDWYNREQQLAEINVEPLVIHITNDTLSSESEHD